MELNTQQVDFTKLLERTKVLELKKLKKIQQRLLIMILKLVLIYFKCLYMTTK